MSNELLDAYTGPIKDLESQNEAAAKSCSTIALVVIAACLFSNLTCGSFSDAALISKSAVTASIPSLGLSLPVLEFLLATPWLLLALHVYFLVHLSGYESLAKELSAKRLKAGFNDSAKIHHSIFASLFHDCSTDVERGWNVSRLEKVLALLLAYFMAPFSILLVWFRALALHDFVAFVAIAGLTLAIGVSIWEYSRPWNFLCQPKVLIKDGASRWFSICCLFSLVALGFGYLAFSGDNYGSVLKIVLSTAGLAAFTRWLAITRCSRILPG